MPNIRIKDIPTTASATSSTDFIGIDGSANGTRKLNAYSPTFGGNLTVSGGTARFQDPTNSYGVTITTAAAKTLVETLFGGSSLGIRVGGSGSDSLTIASTGATIRDNLTVSGTGLSSVAGGLKAQSIESVGTPASYNTTGGILIAGYAGSSYALVKAYSDGGGTEKALTLQPGSGNVLVGTVIDGGQKLQVSGNAYVSGGLSSGGNCTIGGTLSVNGTDVRITAATGYFYAGSPSTLNGFAVSSASNRVDLYTNNIVALTLDSSQQAKFSSAIYCNTTTQSSGVAGAKLITKQTSGTGDWTVTLDGNPDGVAGASYGLRILAGTNSSDYSLYIRNQTNTTTLLAVKGSGRVNMGALPTSSTGLSAGDIWNDAGTLKIV